MSSIIGAAFMVQQNSYAADKKDALSPAQKKQIESLIHDYILNNPEIIPEAIERFKNDPKAIARFKANINREQIDRTARVLKSDKGMIYNDQISPFLGNPDGDVVIVEFYDYNCGYCKESLSIIKKIIKSDPNIKVIFKELPVLAESSYTAALASLAADKQGKFEEFHTAMLTNSKKLDDERIYEIASSVGININKLKEDMKDPLIERAIRDNSNLATKLGISGTPAFIIGDILKPGYILGHVMRATIEEVRAKKK